jgi:flavin reductase (DIM6/NTAB) family NADH-FMN oxidoreductase RutF
MSTSREFVINIPDEKMTETCDFCGTRSGRDFDKFEDMKLTKEKGLMINTPMIKECPVNIECRVQDIIQLGTHDIFISEILNVNADEKIIYSDGDIDYEKIEVLSYLMGHYLKNKIIK